MVKAEILKKAKDRVRKMDPVKTVGEHLVGDTYSSRHRITTGVVIMVIGVLVSKTGGGMIVHLIVDVVGYGLHGLGLIPFVDHLVDHYKKHPHED